MVCLSHSGTMKLEDRLAEDHDVKVQMDDLLPRLKVISLLTVIVMKSL